MLGAAAGWGALFLLVRHVLSRRQSAEFANRVVSLVHAVVAAYLAAAALAPDFYRGALWSGMGGPSTPAQAREPGFAARGSGCCAFRPGGAGVG